MIGWLNINFNSWLFTSTQALTTEIQISFPIRTMITTNVIESLPIVEHRHALIAAQIQGMSTKNHKHLTDLHPHLPQTTITIPTTTIITTTIQTIPTTTNHLLTKLIVLIGTDLKSLPLTSIVPKITFMSHALVKTLGIDMEEQIISLTGANNISTVHQ